MIAKDKFREVLPATSRLFLYPVNNIFGIWYVDILHHRTVCFVIDEFDVGILGVYPNRIFDAWWLFRRSFARFRYGRSV